MSELKDKPSEPVADYVGWYCAHCNRAVDASEVTYHEQCPECGRVITNDVPPRASARPSTQGEAIPAEIRKMGELLRTQDNRYTDQPMFIVQQKRIVFGFDTDYSQGDDDIVWWMDDCHYFAGSPEFEEMERSYKKTGDIPLDWHRHGFTTQWEFVTSCFTEQGCKDYLAIDGHNLKEPRIYADGSYRNKEYRAIRDWLMALASAQPTNSDVWDAALEEAAEIFDAPVRAVLLNSDVCELIRALKSTSAQGGDK